MTTSGTASTTIFKTRKVIEHSFRRCQVVPQKITPEDVQTALDLLYLVLSTLGTKGIALWCIQKVISGMYANTPTVLMPVGTIDLLNCNLRTTQRLTGTYTSSSGVAANAFDGDIATACTLGAPSGSITMQLASATLINTVGILPNVSANWDVTLQYSDDGITWTSFYTVSPQAVTLGQWIWVDFEGLIPHLYWRVQAGGGTTLNIKEVYWSSMAQEIPLYKMNRDDYSNMSNKAMNGRPVQFWYDKQRTQPSLHMWPAPDNQFTFSQLVSYTQRYVQDVGLMQQELEVPQRWYLPIICELSRQLARSLPEQKVNPMMIPQLDQDAREQMAVAWDGETDSSPTRLSPNISPYTR